MTKPRSELISLTDTQYYHCVSRCVRRAFLCGTDHYSGQCYEHRRDWLEQKLLDVASIFAIRLCAYAVMSNHYHVVLHVRLDIAESWSDYEVACRWHQLYNGTPLSHRFLAKEPLSQSEMRLLTPLIQTWRARLTDISWYMRIVNEHIARQANAEDQCTGRFWEGRFKSQALLDEAAVLACMAYVDLNPIRAKMAKTPETSEFTSIHKRIHALNTPHQALEDFTGINSDLVGIPYLLRDYLELVDWTGRIIREDKRGFITSGMPKLLDRLNLADDCWVKATRQFEQHRTLKIDHQTIQSRFTRQIAPI